MASAGPSAEITSLPSRTDIDRKSELGESLAYRARCVLLVYRYLDTALLAERTVRLVLVPRYWGSAVTMGLCVVHPISNLTFGARFLLTWY